MLGAAGAIADAKTKPTVNTFIASGATVNATGAVNLLSTVDNDADANTMGLGGGIVGVGVSLAYATIDGTTNTYVSGAIPSAGSLQIAAKDVSDADTDALAVSGGVVSGSGSEAKSKTNRTVNAYLSGGAASVGANGSPIAGNVVVRAESTTDADSDTTGASVGAVSIGVAISDSQANPTVTSYIGAPLYTNGGVTIDALHNVSPGGTPINNISYSEATAGSGSLVGGTGADSDAVVSPTVKAYADSTGALRAGSSSPVSIRALSNNKAESKVLSVAVGLVAGGAALSDAKTEGTTEAYINRNLNQAGSLAVQADSIDSAVSDTTAGAGGVVSGAGADSDAFVKPKVKAYIGNGRMINATGAITIEANTTPYGKAKALGVSVGLVGGVGVSLAGTDFVPTTDAYVGSNTTVTAASLNVSGHQKLPSGGYSTELDATAGAGGLLIGGSGAEARAKADGLHVKSYVGNDSTLNVGSTSISAQSNLKQNSKSGSYGVGFIGIGVAVNDVTSTTTTHAYLGKNVNASGNSLSITATGSDNNFAESKAGAGGLIGGAGTRANTTTNSTTTAEIQDRDVAKTSRGKITLHGGTGAFTLGATHTSTVNGKNSVVAGGAFSGAGVESNHNVNSAVTASVGDRVAVSAKAVQVNATNNLRKPTVSGHNISGGAGSLLAAGADVESETYVTFNTKIDIGNSASIIQPGNLSGYGTFSLHAKNDLQARDSVNFLAFGAIAGVGARSKVITHTDLAQIQVGNDATLSSATDLYMSARGSADIQTKVNADAGGFGTVILVDAVTQVMPVNKVRVKRGANVEATGDLKIATGRPISIAADPRQQTAERDTYKMKARSDSVSYSAIPITDINATNTLIQNNLITLDEEATFKSDGSIYLYAEKFGFQDKNSFSAYSRGVSWTESFVTGGKAINSGTALTEARGLVTLNGNVITGENRHKRLDLVGWGDGSVEADPATLTPGIYFSAGNQRVSSTLFDALKTAKENKATYTDNPDLQAFYQSQINRIENQLLDEGFMEEVTDGAYTKLQAVEQSAITATIEPFKAQAGIISVNADMLTGKGNITSPGDASVKIVNKTPAYLALKGIEIPATNGGLYFNTTEMSNQDNKAEILAEIDKTSQATINETGFASERDWFNVHGSKPDFKSVSKSGDSAEPEISVKNTLNVNDVNGQPPHNATYTQPNILLLPKSQGGTGITNENGCVIIEAGEGDSIIEGTILSKCQTIVAGGSVVIQDLTEYHVSGDPYAQWKESTVDGTKSAYPAPPEGLPYDSAQDPDSPNLMADRITIQAEFINVNGIIQSGQSDWSYTIPSGVDGEIAQLKNSGASGIVKLSGHTQFRKGTTTIEDFVLRYDVANDQLILDPVRARGGYVSLEGHILNTAKGSIKALGGFSHADITNNSTADLVIKKIDVSQRGMGEIAIYDYSRPSTDVDDPETGIDESKSYQTIYRQDASGTTKEEERGSLVPVSASTSFDPQGDWRYGWSVGQAEWTRRYGHHESCGSWIAWENYDRNSIHWGAPETTSATLIPDSNYFVQNKGSSGAYKDPYTYSKVTVSEPEAEKVIDQWSTSSWYGKKCHNIRTVGEQKHGHTMTHTVDATRHAIGIEFTGHAEGQVGVTSNKGGSIILGGPISNTGSTTLTTTGAIETTSSLNTVSGRQVVLDAKTGIGTDQQITTKVTDGTGSLKATTDSGVVKIYERFGDLQVDQIISQDSSDVTVVSAGQITVASSKAGEIAGGSITLTAAGDVGKSGSPIVLDSGTTQNDKVTIQGSGSVYINEKIGDLRSNEIRAGGDVVIDVLDGGLVDANSNQVRDTRTYNQLKNGLWKDLQLVGSDPNDPNSAAAKRETTVVTAARSKETEYDTYWQYRETQPDPAVYDPTHEVTLTAEEDAFYQAHYRAEGVKEGLSGSDLDQYVADAITTLVVSRTTQYRTLHTEFDAYDRGGYSAGELTASHVDGFVYTFAAAEETALRNSVKIWTEEELLYTFSAGLLAEVTDTQASIEDANIVGANITITASKGVGVTGGSSDINLSNKPVSLDTDQRVLLAAAERIDVIYLSAQPKTVGVNFFDKGSSGHTIVRSSGSWLTDGFAVGQFLSVLGDNSANQTDNGIHYEIAAVNADTITLKLGNSLTTEFNKTITIAPVVLNPLAPGANVQAMQILHRQDLDITSSGKINVTANENVFIGSETNVNIGAVVAGDASTGDKIRIKSGQAISNAAGASATNARGSNMIFEAAIGSVGSSSLPIRTNMLGNDTITARASQDIYLTETIGDMNVGTLYAQQGVIVLKTLSGSIVDGLNTDFTNVFATNIYLDSAGAIGETTPSHDYLDIDVETGTGTLTATAQNDITIADTDLDFPIRNVLSKSGDVDLKAKLSMVDVIDLVDPTDPNSGNDIDSAGKPKADVLGNSISTVAIRRFQVWALLLRTVRTIPI
ncbi:MAG: hypothetical protein MK179_19560 [Pirellulaceae bacterium]|nr:hypothetical protein [Pirellulaceae bacterium]